MKKYTQVIKYNKISKKCDKIRKMFNFIKFKMCVRIKELY